jgi:EF hand
MHHGIPSSPLLMKNNATLTAFPGSRQRWLLFLALGAGLVAGCSSRPAPPVMPAYSPADAARQAMAAYDKNKDGFLDATELEACPSLKSGLKTLDKNKDGKVSADEIESAVEAFQASGAALTAIPCRVKLDGNPLAEATVTLVPEAFMGSVLKPAKGISDATGNVVLQIEGQELPGVPFGFYRVEVSKKDAAGQETLPARYNTQTTLGRMIAPGGRGFQALALHLESS